MTPTLFVALLAHVRRDGAPLHLSLHTTAEGAHAKLSDAARAEWAEHVSYGSGPAPADAAELTDAMRHIGYALSVRELPVELDGAEPENPSGAEEHARLVADAAADDALRGGYVGPEGS